MLKLTLALTALVFCLVLPAAYAVTSKPESKSVAQTLLRQMNSGPDGHITRAVKCAPVSQGSHAFSCDLKSVISTHLSAHVTLLDGGLRTTWEPLKG